MRNISIILKWVVINIVVAIITYYFYPGQFFVSFYFNPNNLVIWSMVSIALSLIINAGLALLSDQVIPETGLSLSLPLSILEEGVFRQLAVLIAKLWIFYSGALGSEVITILVIVCLLQALAFLVLHPGEDVIINRFFLGIVWFVVAWNSSLFPAILGHLTANLSMTLLA